MEQSIVSVRVGLSYDPLRLSSRSLDLSISDISSLSCRDGTAGEECTGAGRTGGMTEGVKE